MTTKFPDAGDTSYEPVRLSDTPQATFEPFSAEKIKSVSEDNVSSGSPQRALEKMYSFCATESEGDADAAVKLGGAWDKAFTSKNFDKINQDYETAIRAAHKAGGDDAVEKLFLNVDDNVETQGKGAMVIPGNPVKIIHAERAREGTAEGTFELSKHPEFGRMVPLKNIAQHSFDLSQPQKFSEFAKSTDFSVARELTVDEKKLVDSLMERNKDLDAESKKALEKAFSALAKGDFDSLAKMTPYGKDMMRGDAEKAFRDTLTAMGFKVSLDGEAERSPDGMRQGSMTIVPPNSNEGIRLTYDRPRGWKSTETYQVEAVKTSVDKNGNLVVESATSVKDVVEKNCAKVVSDFQKFGRPIAEKPADDTSKREMTPVERTRR